MARSFGVLYPQRALRPITWGMAVLFVAALVVQLTHAGIDIFLVLAAAFVLLVIERTLGDWIAESVGAAGTALIFALCAALVVAYALSADGRAKANRFFATAESRGYRPLYFDVDDSASSFSGSQIAHRLPEGTVGLSGGRVPTVATTGDTPPAPPAAAGSAPTSTTGILDWTGSKDRTLRIRLRAEPEVVEIGQSVMIRATIDSGTPPDSAQAIFSVNGSFIARVAFDASGKAATQFVAAVPGYYTARTRISPGSLFGQDVSVTFNVVPGSTSRAKSNR